MLRVRSAIVAMALALAFALPLASAQGSGLAIELQPAHVEFAGGANATTTVRIVSTAQTPMTVRLSVANATGNLTVTFAQNDITLLPGASATARADVRGPLEGDWSLTVLAQERSALGSNATNRAQATLTAHVTQAATNRTESERPTDNATAPPANEAPPENGTPPASSRSWSVNTTPLDLAARAGENATFSVAVENFGADPTVTNVTLRLPLGWGGTLAETVLAIPAGGTAFARGTVTPGAGARDAEGFLAIGDAQGEVVVPLRLHAIAPTSDATPSAPPRKVPSPAPEEREGSTAPPPAASSPEVSLPSAKPTVRVEPAEASVQPGASVVFTVTIGDPLDTPAAGRVDVALVDLVVRAERTEFVVAPRSSTSITFTVAAPEDAVVGSVHAGEVTTTLAGVAPASFRIEIGAAGQSLAPAEIVSESGDDRVLLAIGAASLGAAALAGAGLWRRWPGLGLFALYARLAPRRALEHPRRIAMLALVGAEPGSTIADVQRRLALSNGVARHHLALLESAGLIRITRDGALRRLWPVGAAAVANPGLGERAIAMLHARGPMRAAEIAEALGVSRQALHYHLKRLEAEGRLPPRDRVAPTGSPPPSSASRSDEPTSRKPR